MLAIRFVFSRLEPSQYIQLFICITLLMRGPSMEARWNNSISNCNSNCISGISTHYFKSISFAMSPKLVPKINLLIFCAQKILLNSQFLCNFSYIHAVCFTLIMKQKKLNVVYKFDDFCCWKKSIHWMCL